MKNSGKPFEEWEKEAVRKNYGRMPAIQIGLMIGRTGQGVRQWASKNGLTNSRGHNAQKGRAGWTPLTEEEIAARNVFTDWLHSFTQRKSFATREEIEEYEELAQVRFRRITGRE